LRGNTVYVKAAIADAVREIRKAARKHRSRLRKRMGAGADCPNATDHRILSLFQCEKTL